MDPIMALGVAAGSLSRVEQLLPYSYRDRVPASMAEAAFVFAMINLNDVLQYLKSAGKSLSFSDDMEVGRNITDLVNTFRNVGCHIKSPLGEFAPTNYMRFTVVVGAGTALKIGEAYVGENPHPDDVAFFYGNERIFLRRHILRAINQAKEILEELAKQAFAEAGKPAPPPGWLFR